jgi:hypothetical protein
MIGPLLTMVVLCGLYQRSDCGTNMRPGRAISGMWRILDESVLLSYLELRCGRAHLCRLRTVSVGPYGASIDYVLVHTVFMGSCKLSRFDDHRVG